MSKNEIVYPYIPNSVPEVKAEMLRELGNGSIFRDPRPLAIQKKNEFT